MPEAPKPKEVADPFAGLVPGRIVWYTPRPSEARYAGEGNQGPWAAMVTKVGPLPGVVTLNVNLPVAVAIGTDPVQRMSEVPYSEAQEPGTWAWPPRA